MPMGAMPMGAMPMGAMPGSAAGAPVAAAPAGPSDDAKHPGAVLSPMVGVAYLSSDEAAFVTGANISINGGQHMF